MPGGETIHSSASLISLLHRLEGAMPAAEVVHALHVQALQDPTLKDLPAMQRFTDTSLRHLHAMVAAAGFIRRLMSGDTDAGAVAGLQEQLRLLQPTFGEARSAFTRIMAEAAARQNEAVLSLSQVMGVADQYHKTVVAAAQPLLTVDIPT